MDHLYFVPHTHWDREWYQPFQQMRARLVAMADKMIPLVEQGAVPTFHFDGQTVVLEDYLAVRPEMAPRLKRLVSSGKVQIGPWFVLADSFLVSGESLIRNLEIGMSIARRFGKPLDVGYLPDQFGHTAQLPQILAGFGFRTAVLWRGVPGTVERNRFVWEALDGSSVLTTYLPHGYGNGSVLALKSVESFLKRVGEIAVRERPFADGAPILIMVGTDHTEPDPRLKDRIAEARGTEGFTFEIGALETYVNRLADLPPNGITHHRGELRSPRRAHLLPGVTSARTWIKQRDFHNCALLERVADPLAALARFEGVGNAFEGHLDLAWRFELENHPHDSICGCSVDQVHDDMRYRFDQAAIIAEDVARRAASALLEGRAGEAGLAVFNPTFATRGLVKAEVELSDGSARYSLATANGTRIAAAVDVAGREKPFEIDLPASEFKGWAAQISEPTIQGRAVNGYDLRRVSAERFELDLFVSRVALGPAPDLEAFRARIRNELPDTATVHVRMTNAARAAISFVAEDLAQAGLSYYRLERESPGNGERVAPPTSGTIENEYFRVVAGGRGLEITELENGQRLELHFEDEGDRGDEYNFDPVPNAAPIDSPAKLETRVSENGAVRKRIVSRFEFNLPRSLAPDRGSRESSTEPLTIELTTTLWTGLRRIDCEAAVVNRSRDHRLRVALRTPIAAVESVSDTSFGVLRRPVVATEPAGMDDVYPTAPQRSWTAVESESLSAAMMARGLYEAEVRRERDGSAILLTLLRCVGWLSRSDLATRRGGAGPELETPGAQELGEHRFEFAVTTGRGSYSDWELVQSAATYAFRPTTFAARVAPGAAPLKLLGCNNSQVAFSTARPLGRAGRFKVRAFSTSPRSERAKFTFPAGARARRIDLAGRLAKNAPAKRSRDGSLELELRPFEIVTFEVSRAHRR